MVRWEDESKDYIQNQEPVSDEPDKLKEQIANFTEFKQAVDGNFNLFFKRNTSFFIPYK